MPFIRAILIGRLSTVVRGMVATAALLAGPALASAQTTRPCLTPDATSASVVHLGVTLVSDTSAKVASFRTKYSIPNGTAADVVVVQDNALCEALTAAMDSVATPTQEAYHVIQLGSVSPRYLLAKRQSVGFAADVYLLTAQGGLLVVLK